MKGILLIDNNYKKPDIIHCFSMLHQKGEHLVSNFITIPYKPKFLAKFGFISLFFSIPAYSQGISDTFNEQLITNAGYAEEQVYFGAQDNTVFGRNIPEWFLFMDNNVRLSVKSSSYFKGSGDFHLYYQPLFDSTNLLIQPDVKKLYLKIFNFYIRFMPADWLYVTLGKSQLDWSLAFAYPSSGKINNLKNVFNPEVLGEGINNVNITLYSPFASFIIGVIPPEDGMKLSDTGAAARLNFRWFNTDIAIQGSRIYRDKLNSSLEATISQEISGFIIYGETALYKPNNYIYFDKYGNIVPERTDISGEKKPLPDNINLSGTIGFNKAILDKGFLIFELQHKTDGYTDNELSSYIKVLKSSLPEVKQLALSSFQLAYLTQNHLYLRYRYNFSDFFEPGFDMMISMPDFQGSDKRYSALFAPEIATDFFNGGTIRIGCYIPVGGDNTEFSLFPYNWQSFIRVKIYF